MTYLSYRGWHGLKKSVVSPLLHTLSFMVFPTWLPYSRWLAHTFAVQREIRVSPQGAAQSQWVGGNGN